MDFELDFLPVGKETQSGDAIVFRYGNLQGDRNDWRVIVVDAGFEETGNEVVEHIKNVYNTDSVDLVISTHPDNDHAGGIPTVLSELNVKKLWIHKPWEHTKNISKLFEHHAVTDSSVENRIEKGLKTAKTIFDVAEEKGITIEEPFTGLQDDGKCVVVLGPDKNYYITELIPNFRCTPEAKESLFAKIISKTENVIESAMDFVKEAWDIETLDNSGDTTAENNSSVVILITIDDYHIILTSDAGQPALERIINVLDSINYDYSKIKFIQAPHHGSHRNVNPTILDKLVGQKLSSIPDYTLKTVVASVAQKEDKKHPSKKVANAFRRRGAPMHITRGGLKYHHLGNAPRKNLYNQSIPLPLFDEINKDEE